MAGHVTRPSIKDINFDLNTLKLIKIFSLDYQGDDKLLSSISIFFKNHGFPILDWKSVCKDLFINKDYLTIKKPSKNSIFNRNKGLETFKLNSLYGLIGGYNALFMKYTFSIFHIKNVSLRHLA